ncbi:MAG: PAS domain S-box protein [Candidatus Scalinduaceae bacterium]
MFKSRSIKTKFIVFICLTIFLPVGIFVSIVIDLHIRNLSMVGETNTKLVTSALANEWEEKIRAITSLLAKELVQSLNDLDVTEMNYFAKLAMKEKGFRYVYIYDKNGRVLIDTTKEAKLLGEVLTDEYTRKIIIAKDLLIQRQTNIVDVAAPIMVGLKKLGTVRIGFSIEEIQNTTNLMAREISHNVEHAIMVTLRNTLLLLFVILVVAMAVGVFFMRALVAPIKELVLGTERISKGDLTFRIDVKSKDEFGQLAASFNKMTEGLQNSRYKLISAKDYTGNIIKSMVDTLIVISPDKTIKTVNQATLRLLRYEEKELIGKSINIIFTADEKLFEGREFDNLIRIGYMANIEKVYRTKNDRKIPVLFSCSVMHDVTGEIEGIVCVALDISHRKQAEEKLKNTYDELRAIQTSSVNLMEDLEKEVMERKRIQEGLQQANNYSESLTQSSHDMIISVDKDRNIVTFNRTAEETFGYTRDEVLGRHVEMLYADPLQSENVYNATRSNDEFEGVVLNRRKNGDTFTAQLTATMLRDENGKFIGLMGISRDITERKRVEKELKTLNESLEQRVTERTANLAKANNELLVKIDEQKRTELALKESEERLQAIIDNTTAVIYLKDTKGRYILINHQYETLFHVTKNEVVGKTDYDIFPEDKADAFRENDKKVLKAGTSIEFEEIAPHDDGPHSYISLKFPLSDSHNVIYGVCGISTDITERKRLEEELKKGSRKKAHNSFPSKKRGLRGV